MDGQYSGGVNVRQQRIEEMQLRRFSERTIESYVRAVGQLAGWCWKSPDEVLDEELRDYFLYLKNQKRWARATTTIALCGIKFFFESTFKRDWTAMNISRPRAEHKQPVVLSREEVRAILGQVTELRHRACLTLLLSSRRHPVHHRGPHLRRLPAAQNLHTANLPRTAPRPRAVPPAARLHLRPQLHALRLTPAPAGPTGGERRHPPLRPRPRPLGRTALHLPPASTASIARCRHQGMPLPKSAGRDRDNPLDIHTDLHQLSL